MTSSAAAQPRYGPLAPHRPLTRAWLLPFLVAGLVCIIGGGLLAAATAYVTTQKTAWATAYIVLVGGIAQAGLGTAVAWLSPLASRRLARWSFAAWNVGNIGVVTGQLAGWVVLTDIGAALLVAALIMVLIAVRRRIMLAPSASATADDRAALELGPGEQPTRYVPLEPAHPAALWLFRGLVGLLALSLPVGVFLAHLG